LQIANDEIFQVEKPDKSKVGVMRHGRVLGDLYDQLLRLDHFYGTHLGIDILIIGEEVRVCWRGNHEENVHVEADEIIGDDPLVPIHDQKPRVELKDRPRRHTHRVVQVTAPLDGSAERRSPPELSTSPSKLNPRPHMLRVDITPNADLEVTTKMAREEQRS